MTGKARKKGWLYREWVLLPTWLLNSSSAKVTFGWAFTWDTRCLHTHFSFGDIYLYHFPQMFFSSIFQSCSFQIPYPPVSLLATDHNSASTYLTHLVLSPSKWNVQPCVPPKALFPVNIPSLLSQNGVIKSAAVHFWAVPAECPEPEVTQAIVFSSSVKSS